MAFGGFIDFFNREKTFKPQKKFTPGTMRQQLHKNAMASLSAGIDLKEAVKLPRGEDYNDWLAVHVVDFYNRISLIYGTVSEHCTEAACPKMSGGAKYEYQWADKVQYKKPTSLPAPVYIGLLMDWVEEQINDDRLFPGDSQTPFPKNYTASVKKILTRLFRVFVHVYIHHFDRLRNIGAEAHVNTCYKHFYYFVTEFGLVDKKELEPLKEMTMRLCR
ncbi:hypothetical protein BOX15_Mlig017823g1 [Macrostomum lignano]|uniref:Mob1_phocein domain-containing protein n=2 Tax=Macrostomum lignano TaxID=282301 RepID=A0A267EB35_9PLAT|nr:hypothetical protein BOX15_Mlig007641g1 [Macrostomum lignano]PAA58801.1 hypothetical protein BOX15_Mlig023019g1 [Macrostomum lignano]PAA76682.1 hypothetical protein BOX15_Mlig017823g1 [Macrostomum lignano]